MVTTILVTGGAGFIGSHIVEVALTAGHRVRVLDDFSTGKRANLAPFINDIEIVEGDLVDPAALNRAVQGVAGISHQAAKISVPGSLADPHGYNRTNVEGTLRLLEAAARAGVSRITFASSCAVYGDNADLPLSEASQTRPLSPYAATKLIGEVYLQTWAILYGFGATAFRYFNVFGPRQDPASEYAAVIPKFIARLNNGQPPIIFGDGHQTRDFVYVGDIARANLRALTDGPVGFRVCNLGSGVSRSLLDLVADLNNVIGTTSAPVHEPARPGDIRHSSANVDRAAHLGLAATTSWIDGLRATVRSRARA